MLSSGHNNTFLGNNIIGSTQCAVYLSFSDYNTFYHNNFLSNAQQAKENHEVYWWTTQNNTYYSENNAWDNGKEGNYWDDYSGIDANRDGIGETLYTVYENFTDKYPLTAPFDIESVSVESHEWISPSSDSSPGPQTENAEPSASLETESFPTALVATISVTSATVVGIGLLCTSRNASTKTFFILCMRRNRESIDITDMDSLQRKDKRQNIRERRLKFSLFSLLLSCSLTFGNSYPYTHCLRARASYMRKI